MFLRCGMVLLLLALPSTSQAQDAPEHLLPATTQIYARWDGILAHRNAYAKTALGKMMQGDTGKFLASVVSQLQDLAGSQLTVENLLQGVPPDQLQRIQAEAKDAPQLIGLLGQHGLVIGVEVRSLEPPAVQLTIIVPDAGAKPAPLFGTLHLITSLLKVAVKEAKIAGRDVHHLQEGPVHVAWWVEGKHAIVTVGTDHPEAVIKRMTGQEPRLTENPLFKKVQGFDQFETGARAFVDVAAFVKLAKSRGKEVSKLITDLGLDGLKSWTFHSGFDGEVERSLSELHIPGPRRGVLRMVSGKPFKLSDLPLVPPDAGSWSATNFDAGILYDAGLQAVEGLAALFSADALLTIKETLKQVDLALGINLRNDLLGALGDQFMQYSSPTDGPLVFGQTFLFKVKDAKKLQGALEQSIKALAQLAGGRVSIKKTTYRGVTLNSVYVRQQGFPFVPTYTIHKDWLVLSYFPQAVQGYILRSSGALPAWKPDEHVLAALEKLPKEYVSISVSDPRPSVKQLLSIAPPVGGLIKSLVPESKFDVASIPNGHEATQHLFPNVSVVSDDQSTLRSETRASLVMPIELSGLDTYALFIGAGFIFPFLAMEADMSKPVPLFPALQGDVQMRTKIFWRYIHKQISQRTSKTATACTTGP